MQCLQITIWDSASLLNLRFAQFDILAPFRALTKNGLELSGMIHHEANTMESTKALDTSTVRDRNVEFHGFESKMNYR
jgi:hypothetical protein